ncbi:MAG: hypothetical protein IT203_07490 [Fimbriimonadaceae bacterium]|nr:hypothetical protein [Fimbriimonadaceae bacterium]
MDASDMVGGLLIAVSSGVVLGIAALHIMYKTIDGDIPVAMGLGSLVAIVGVLLMTARPPHPAVPAVVLVVALTLMAFFPFALSQLDKADLNSFDVDRLERSFTALRERPDNFASKLEVAAALHSQGMVHQAIAIASAALDTIPDERDMVTNRSLRDQFRNEDYKVKQWMRNAGKVPLMADHLRCRACNHENPVQAIVCERCGNWHLLDAARRGDNRPRVIGKLVLAWGLLALFLVGSASLGLSLKGGVGIGVFAIALGGLGGTLYLLFRPPLRV